MFFEKFPKLATKMPIIKAPFSSERIAQLGALQEGIHPYVCPADGTNLVVSEQGLAAQALKLLSAF